MSRLVLAAGVAGLLAPAGAWGVAAAELEASSALEAVTVYPDGAALTRAAKLALPQGATTVIVRGLSPFVDPASIRVSGEAGAALSIVSVDVQPVPGDARPAIDPALEAKLEAFRAQREALTGAIEAAEMQKSAIRRFSEAGPEKLSADAGPLAIEKWPSAWEAIGQGLTRVNAALADLNARAAKLDAEIEAVEKARPDPNDQGAPRRDVAIAVEAVASTSATLRLQYRVAQARWQPVYDVRLDTGGKDRKPALELMRRARITQKSGEDWTNVALSVSTVRASRGTAAPDLGTLVVNFADAVRPLASAPPPAAAMMRAAEEERAHSARARSAVLAKDVDAELEAGAFQASFAVPGQVTVPRDGSPRLLTLSTRSLASGLAVRTAPAVDDTAYLEASFVHEEDAPLLAGEVALTRDGTYVGRGRLKLTAPGETVELGFGADDRVRVKRMPVKKETAEPGWIGNTRSETTDFRTTVRNLHDRPIRILVVDRLPTPENADITVEQLGQTTPPTEKNLADRRGVLGWSWDYQPGEQKEIMLAYRLKWPAEREIVLRPGLPQPVPR